MITFYIKRLETSRPSYKTVIKASCNTIKEYNNLSDAKDCYSEVSKHLPCAVIYDGNYGDNQAHLSFPTLKELEEIHTFRTKYPNCR